MRSASLIVEVDEIQHFTTDRLRTLEFYPEAALLAFDVGEYRTLISQWSSVADNYRAAKPAVDFPHPAGGEHARVLRCRARPGRTVVRLDRLPSPRH